MKIDEQYLNVDIYTAMKNGSSILKETIKKQNLDSNDVNDLMDEINEQTLKVNDISRLLSENNNNNIEYDDDIQNEYNAIQNEIADEIINQLPSPPNKPINIKGNDINTDDETKIMDDDDIDDELDVDVSVKDRDRSVIIQQQ